MATTQRRHCARPEPAIRAPIFICLIALAGALAGTDHERARLLLRKALALEARLDYETWFELTQAPLISARLQDWDQALELASRSIRHLRWGGKRPLLAEMFNIVARILAPTRAEHAAIIQGAAHTFATTPTHTGSGSGAAAFPGQLRPTKAATTSFVTDLRRETTGLLQETSVSHASTNSPQKGRP